MQSMDKEALAVLEETGALLTGHFILRSGLHSGHYFQCARVCEHLDKVERLAALLVEKLPAASIETVIAPAMGGLVIGQEVARQIGARFLFAEKEQDRLVVRRGFTLREGERVLVVEDVITRGGRVQETLDLVRGYGGEPVGVAVLVDRSDGKARFGLPLTSLLELTFATYKPDQIPVELSRIPATKPGS